MNVLDDFNTVDTNAFVTDTPFKIKSITLTITDKQGLVVLTKQRPAGFQMGRYHIAIEKVLSPDYGMKLSINCGVVKWIINMNDETNYTIT